MTRSLTQQQASALTLLRNAAAQGKDTEACIEFAVAALGRESEALVRAVWRNHFETMGPV